jgi:DNA-binding MarR family transcriptional regulator
VRREECPGDARGSLVVLTEQGRRAIEEAAPGHVASVRRHMIDLLTPAEITALGDLSQRVIEHFTEPPRGRET